MLRRVLSMIFGRGSKPARSRYRRLRGERLEDRYALTVGVVAPYGFGPTVDEGNQGTTTTLQFDVAYFGDCVSPFTINYETADIDAVAGVDYQSKSGTLQFNGVSGQILQVSVTVNGDRTTELDELLRFSVTGVSNPEVEIGEPTTGTIENDDQTTVNVKLAPGQLDWMDEGTVATGYGSVIEYYVSLTNPVDIPITVRLNAAGDGANPATPGTDFVILATGTGNDPEIVVPAGQTTAGYVSVYSVGDSVPEYDEAFRVFVEDIVASGRDVNPGSDVTGEIRDDDLATYTPNVVISDAQVTEGDSGFVEMRFSVQLLNDIVGGVNVSVRSRGNWSAEDDIDFEIKQDVLQLGGPYPMSRDFVVQVHGDTDREAHEKFYGLITNAESIQFQGMHQPFVWSLGPHAALGTINNNDQGPYTQAQNTVAIYHGADPGDPNDPSFADGSYFRVAGQRYGTDASFDVTSWANAVSQLETWVAANGRIAVLYLFDHGSPTQGQQMGDSYIPYNGYELLAPLFDDNGIIILVGCEVALAPAVEGGIYSDFVADDAAPGVLVESSTVHNWMFPTGEYIGDFQGFNGIEAPPSGVTP